VIQEKTVRPVGASSETALDVRILSATHKNLSRLVEEGNFRHDLYYRINVIELPVPPLRERREDILPIAQSILHRLSAELGEPVPTLSAAAAQALGDYHFPGNVRELENILERAVALCEGGAIGLDDLALPAAPPNRGDDAGPVRAAAGARADSALPDALEQIEREAIQKALEACRYNKTRAAAQLGITFRALRYKLKKLDME
jgi:two-component system response regulator PilR (NtrC family)